MTPGAPCLTSEQNLLGPLGLFSRDPALSRPPLYPPSLPRSLKNDRPEVREPVSPKMPFPGQTNPRASSQQRPRDQLPIYGDEEAHPYFIAGTQLPLLPLLPRFLLWAHVMPLCLSESSRPKGTCCPQAGSPFAQITLATHSVMSSDPL